MPQQRGQMRGVSEDTERRDRMGGGPSGPDGDGGRVPFDSDKTTPVSVAVVSAVADMKCVSVDDLDRLHNSIDPDCLDHFVSSASTGKLVFECCCCEVTVYADSTLTVDSLE